MFTLPTELSERIEQALAQRVCTAADGSYIRCSYGRRRAGRPAKYTVHMADGSSFIVKAHDDGAAVDLANKRSLTKRATDAPMWRCKTCGAENSFDNANCSACGESGRR